MRRKHESSGKGREHSADGVDRYILLMNAWMLTSTCRRDSPGAGLDRLYNLPFHPLLSRFLFLSFFIIQASIFIYMSIALSQAKTLFIYISLVSMHSLGIQMSLVSSTVCGNVARSCLPAFTQVNVGLYSFFIFFRSVTLGTASGVYILALSLTLQ